MISGYWSVWHLSEMNSLHIWSNKKFSSASKVFRLLFAQRFITIFNCRYHTSNHLSESHKPTSLSPINCQSTKKSSTIKSWPTFCDQYFWKFPIWNSLADEKHREIRMVKVFKWYPVIDLFDTLQVNLRSFPRHQRFSDSCLHNGL
jgi:hypothetical protein